ncbi:thiol oxidoreductase [Methyloceanibacter methanicus]|uniref:Thiol oxidoreductase n=1 Tax=Methyloceanibacter methanicus TaxID=1774968 RepID=A0A1E3W335_9HYPH|nr:di-heme oxidoredictase family protein [Methyloceanibacter methanicus]ODR99911.1 thiol oxidoreductase [Methyloceanibacter methanicus]
MAGMVTRGGTAGETAMPEVLAPATDFSRAEPGEDLPGGDATSRRATDNVNAFSQSSGNMGFRKELDFKIGNSIFRRLWVSAPASTDASDGLGPLFNVRGCQNCHLKDGRGQPPAAAQTPGPAGALLFRLSVPPKTDADRALLASGKVTVLPDPVYGGQLQDMSIQGHEPEGAVKITYVESDVSLADGETVSLRAPSYELTGLNYGPISPDVMVGPRIAPPMIGLGLLEAVPEEQIMAYADPADEDGDGISGRPNRIWSALHDKEMIGRFGWKANVPTMAEQNAAAFSGDIGISTTLHPSGAGDCTEKQTKCFNAPSGNSPKYQNVEVGDELFDLMTFYTQNLAVPRRRTPDAPEILNGKALFYETGCADCHRPKLLTGEVPKQPHLSNQLIWPYTDMLLHDMGEGLADNRPDGLAGGQEWRTPPLWGIGLTETVNGHTQFLHDGRARNLTEAILWHGGEAQEARDTFAALDKEDRERLLAFVNSL